VSSIYKKLGLDELLAGEVDPAAYLGDSALILSHLRGIVSQLNGSPKARDIETLAFHVFTLPNGKFQPVSYLISVQQHLHGGCGAQAVRQVRGHENPRPGLGFDLILPQGERRFSLQHLDDGGIGERCSVSSWPAPKPNRVTSVFSSLCRLRLRIVSVVISGKALSKSGK